jgi:hypothetical protein
MLNWVVVLWLWRRGRRPIKLSPVERLLPRRRPDELRDALGRAAALQTPPWELIGGDAHGALFELPTPGHPVVSVFVQPADGGARVHCEAASDRPRWFDPAMGSFAVLIPLAAVTFAALLWAYVAPHPQASVRAQSAQVMQLVHLLWPPYLVFGLRRRFATLTRQAMGRFVTTLELL